MAGSMPNAEGLHHHLKGLFDGKIGSLAKEMAEEIAKDLGSLLGEEGEDIKSTQDFLKKMIRNPKKLMELMKKVSSKLNDKMKSGDISQDELMREASEWMGKMKGMGGADNFGEVFKNLAKNMGGLGKNTKMDMNAMNRMLNRNTTKERMAAKLEKKKLLSSLSKICRKQKNAVAFKIIKKFFFSTLIYFFFVFVVVVIVVVFCPTQNSQW
jgi:hypothetical protein